jgi:hypothetical protein
VGQSDEFLPPERRISYYRGMASEALRLAQLALDDAQKMSYLDIATRWNHLATETERLMALKSRSSGRRSAKSEPHSNGERK